MGEVERVSTADGARLAVKRKPVAEGVPVVFVHGLAVNADLWDLPEIRGPGFHFKSLAATLQDAGYDVWLLNLRGHGAPRMLSAPPEGQTDWCVDHFVLFDLPATVDHVMERTGRRPFVIGASMGAMTLGGYVQGARWEGEPESSRIVADQELARDRRDKLAGCIFAEFPAALRWPESLYNADGQVDWRALLRDWWRREGGENYAFEMLSRWGWLHAVLESAGEVPLAWLGGDPEAEPWYAKLPGPLAEGAEWIERSAVQAMLQIAGTFTGGTNHRAEVMLRGRRYVMDHMKAGVLRQLAKCVRRRGFVSALGSPDHVYSDHYGLVELPTLVLQGGRDRIANAGVTREAFFDRIEAADKEFLLYDEIAHGEIEAAPVASEKVYPAILAWLNARARR